jgi:two-component system, NtrC family, response regulator GlrR
MAGESFAVQRLLVVSDGRAEEASRLRAMLDQEAGWHVASTSTHGRTPSDAEPDLVVWLVPEGPRSPAGHRLPARCRPDRTLMVLPGEAFEEDLGGLPEVGDIIVPPLRPAEMRARVRRLLAQSGNGSRRPHEALGADALVGEAPAFVALKARLPRIARADAAVLLSGETGTGKEMVARAVHHLGPRAGGPFLPVNCGAIPTDLFENELFGHRRGAFTDARDCVEGVIGEADGGTLFLDEVDSIPLLSQVKLLQFLQNKSFRPLGASAMRRVDVRIVAATNADLEARMNAGTFRPDLFYRLSIIPLVVPPLRERPGDVPLLVDHFLAKHAPAGASGRWRFTADFMEALQAYDWPGNVRELENLIQRTIALTPAGEVGVDALPARLQGLHSARPPVTFREAKAQAIARFEREYASRLLVACNGNVTQAASAARKDRRAFGRLVKKYGIAKANPR